MEQVYLRAFLALVNRWKLLAGVMVLAGAGSVAVEMLRPPAYEAEAILERAGAIVGERNTFANVEGMGADKYTVSSSFADQIPGTEGPTVLKDLLESTTVIGGLYETLKEKNAFHNGEAPELPDFTTWLTAEVNVVDQTTRPVSYSPILFLRSKGRTAEEAIAIADTWAQSALDLAQNSVRLKVGPITDALTKLEAEQSAKLTAILSEKAALEAESGGAVLEEQLESVLRDLGNSNSAAVMLPENARDPALPDRIKRLESERDALQPRVTTYNDERDWLAMREKVARENYVDIAANLVRAETAGRIALSKDAGGKLIVGLNLLVDHAYAKETRGMLGKKGNVLAATFVAAVLAAACVVAVDVLVPSLSEIRNKS